MHKLHIDIVPVPRLTNTNTAGPCACIPTNTEPVCRYFLPITFELCCMQVGIRAVVVTLTGCGDIDWLGGGDIDWY